MTFNLSVITFSGFNLTYGSVAPHPHSIFKRLGSSEHFDDKFGFGGAKKLPSFSLSFHARFGLMSVLFTIVSLFFCVGLLFY